MSDTNLNLVAMVMNKQVALVSGAEWHLIAPIGEIPGTMLGEKGGKIRIVQVLNREALQKIAERVKEPILVDREHWSDDPDGDTSAMAWINNVELREDGLYARFEWTDEGMKAVENKRYRFVSPVFAVPVTNKAGARVQPLALLSVALTNKPNIKGLVPLRNRAADDAHEAENTGGSRMKGVLTLLGLQEDAEESSVISAIQALMDRAAKADEVKARAETAEAEAATAKNKVAEFETKALEREADEFCAANEAVIRNKDDIRALYVENKAATLKLVAAMKPAEAKPAAKVLNRADAKQPEGQAQDQARVRQEREKVVEGLVKNKGMSYADAYAHAATTRPELFAK